MAGIKRKSTQISNVYSGESGRGRQSKKVIEQWPESRKIEEVETDSDPIVESDTTSQSGADDGASWPGDDDAEVDNDEGGVSIAAEAASSGKPSTDFQVQQATSKGSSSREAHAKQKSVLQERKAAKPNADFIARSKKIWERLRQRSNIMKEERAKLKQELFEIITGRVHDFVTKHDATRIIQTALKYGNQEQRKMIAKELKGSYKELAKGRYSKFLIGKILVHGDDEIREMVVQEFYGHVRNLIKHPEASWILDDIYRGIATPEQKALLLREWYGAEFALFRQRNGDKDVSSDLKILLKERPEKRTPVMRSLLDLINHLVQKKTAGFTMLHDAMLQYYLNTSSGSEEASEFIELLKGDDEGDLLKNLAFTKSGARLICLALAHGTAKDRKHILRVYKGLIQSLAYDVHGHQILLAAYDVVDDTVLVSKLIFPELVGKDASSTAVPNGKQQQDLLYAATDLTARVALLYLFAGRSKAILHTEDQKLLAELHSIRTTTSKKDPEVRRRELLVVLSPPLLDLIAKNAADLARSSFGCQFMSEVLLASVVSSPSDRQTALEAIINLLPSSPATSPNDEVTANAYFGRLLKSLILGGKFDPEAQRISPAEPPLGFHEEFYDAVISSGEAALVEWAIGPNSFTVVGLLEAEGFSRTGKVRKVLKANRARLLEAAGGEFGEDGGQRGEKDSGQHKKKAEKKRDVKKDQARNAGSQILLQKIDQGTA